MRRCREAYRARDSICRAHRGRRERNVQSRLQTWPRGHRFKEAGCAVPLGSAENLAQVKIRKLWRLYGLWTGHSEGAISVAIGGKADSISSDPGPSSHSRCDTRNLDRGHRDPAPQPFAIMFGVRREVTRATRRQRLRVSPPMSSVPAAQAATPPPSQIRRPARACIGAVLALLTCGLVPQSARRLAERAGAPTFGSLCHEKLISRRSENAVGTLPRLAWFACDLSPGISSRKWFP